ncbi:MAG: hypothetical protein KJ728_04775 [Alphaproteobacteria bacterium]|jgi:hypothetical protein|nr:hypothetical protein [Brevundimonas sp.]MBU1520719.1 hypothetical protein [Alphaproteobacteria bacterium]MBJ7319532.1 hypothetical protein [Brevundimonas sp.]MBU2030146.1 hypothetical protein [Alphaproteobacteria bacterium]MBU2163196.1 hypothetical protein [Alphaproteobacteria bacterium]MBU2231327.1 hypothetical protein [Alphaproteobacteria bacterium]
MPVGDKHESVIRSTFAQDSHHLARSVSVKKWNGDCAVMAASSGAAA